MIYLSITSLSFFRVVNTAGKYVAGRKILRRECKQMSWMCRNTTDMTEQVFIDTIDSGWLATLLLCCHPCCENELNTDSDTWIFINLVSLVWIVSCFWRLSYLGKRSITPKFVTPTALPRIDNSWGSTTLSPPKKLTSSTANLEWCHVHFIRDSYSTFIRRVIGPSKNSMELFYKAKFE